MYGNFDLQKNSSIICLNSLKSFNVNNRYHDIKSDKYKLESIIGTNGYHSKQKIPETLNFSENNVFFNKKTQNRKMLGLFLVFQTSFIYFKLKDSS